MNIIKKGYELVHQETGKPATEKEVVTCFRGESYILQGGTPPHKPSSTGRVWVVGACDFNREFFPSVVNLEWREL